jgi:hypothetical protein
MSPLISLEPAVYTADRSGASFCSSRWMGNRQIWKEADRSGDKKDWNRFYGQAFCLVYHCANGGQTRHLNTRSSWLHRLLPGFGFLYEATDRLIGARAFSPKI